MGLFGKLFEKKYCSICGREIKPQDSRKLEDGSLCRSCGSLLSPCLDESSHTTVQSIREHLEYREANQSAVAAFRPTRVVGGATKVLVDEAAGTFAVVCGDDWRDANPDIVPMKAIADVQVDVYEKRTELKQEHRTAEGKTERVSFNPPRYKYTYNFWVKIHINGSFPWLDHISFVANEEPITLDSYNSMGRRAVGATSAVNPYTSSRYRETDKRTGEIRQVLMAGRTRAGTASEQEEIH